MDARRSAPGWCPSVRAVLGEPWWLGKFIYAQQAFSDEDGVERSRLTALCPYCGLWVKVMPGDLLNEHRSPAGSQPRRDLRAEYAESEYRKVWARDLKSKMACA